jgi:hypothetical protein
MGSRPVSVLMTAYNREKYIAEDQYEGGALVSCFNPARAGRYKKGYLHSFFATLNVLTANRRRTECGLASGHTRRFPNGVRFKVTGLPLIAIKVVRLMK